MLWFRRKKPRVRRDEQVTSLECPGCHAVLFREDLDANLGVCPACDHHFGRWPEHWIHTLADPGSFEELDAGLEPLDPLHFSDTKPYAERLSVLIDERGIPEALVTGVCRLDSRRVGLGIFDFRFLGGSMGSVVGEKLCRLFERGVADRLPVIVLCASGGARMQEGALSLMQMAKSVASLSELQDAGLPYVSVLLNPTTGGVAASIAPLGDVILAEPHALIGFAGPRVIEQTLGEALPAGFQRADYLLEHGMVDAIVPRKALRRTLIRILAHLVDPPSDDA